MSEDPTPEQMPIGAIYVDLKIPDERQVWDGTSWRHLSPEVADLVVRLRHKIYEFENVVRLSADAGDYRCWFCGGLDVYRSSEEMAAGVPISYHHKPDCKLAATLK